MMRMGWNEPFNEHVHHAFPQLLPLMQTEDMKEGIKAFLEKARTTVQRTIDATVAPSAAEGPLFVNREKRSLHSAALRSGWRKEVVVKFTWFHLMPWPHMPEDFRQKHRSVWVDLPSKMYQPELGHIAYHQYLDQLEYAESVGFDGIGAERALHANAYGPMPSPNIMAATLTRRTSRAALVVLGNSIALYNPPLRVAEEFAMLDVLSGGRLRSRASRVGNLDGHQLRLRHGCRR